MLELLILKQEIYGCWRMVGNWEVNFWLARRPLTDLRWFLGLVSAGEPRQHGMADSLYERMLSTRRVHRLAAILLRRWQAEEIAKTPFPCVSRIWTEYMRSK